MKLHTIALGCLLALQSFTAFSAAPAKLNRENNFDLGWRFLKADAPGAEDAAFNDSAWRTVDLPHDWSLEDLPQTATNGTPLHFRQLRRRRTRPPPAAVADAGALILQSSGRSRRKVPAARPPATRSAAPAGIANISRSTTRRSASRSSIQFDGVYMDSDVWLNGHHLGNHPYGYTAFAYDLTDFLNPPGQENVLAVRVRNLGRNSRWYSGSGIYRHVVLQVTDPLRVGQWGVMSRLRRPRRKKRPSTW